MLSTGKLVALERLVDAWADASDAKRPVWQFAVKLHRLLTAGATESDLRWLIARRYAEQALEVTRPGDDERGFSAVTALTFAENVCFVISHAGLVFVRQQGIGGSLNCVAETAARSPVAGALRWDRTSRELWVNGKLAKRFYRTARAQWAVLDEFQARNWQPRAEIEIRGNGHRDAAQRLREVVAHLNNGLDHSLIKFRTDGSGEGVAYDLP